MYLGEIRTALFGKHAISACAPANSASEEFTLTGTDTIMGTYVAQGLHM